MSSFKARRSEPSLEEICDTLRKHLPQLRERYGVKSVGLFGSWVRDQRRKDSDLDILVDFERPPTLFELMDLEEELEALVGVKVDLVTRKALRGEVGRRILREVLPL